MKLTVFTPTYNRAKTLPRVYNSLKRQSDTRFEWIIVDDGSTDGTEDLVKKWCYNNKDFEIIYYKQEHGGKPRAQNKAVDLATGDYFITCDSNKYLNDHAVAMILHMFDKIRNIPLMCGVGGYRANFKGQVYGGDMLLEGKEYIDCTNLERSKYNLNGDKATAFYTELLRQYKSPEYPGETFVSEAVWLTPMAKDGYKIRWFPEVLVYGEYAEDGLTKQGANEYIGHYNNFYGYLALIRVEMSAKGIDYEVLHMLYEAFEIARKKKWSFWMIAEKLQISWNKVVALNIRRNLGKLRRTICRRRKDNLA